MLDPKERIEAERGAECQDELAKRERERRKLLVAAEKAAARGAVQRHTTAPSIDVGVGRGEGINQTDHACGGYACVSGSEAERMGREKEVGIP